MAFCTKCGNKLLPDAKFCHRCGATVKPVTKPKPVAPPAPAAPIPYKSPIAETYYEVLRPAAEEKLAKVTPKVKRREAPTKPFEERVKARG